MHCKHDRVYIIDKEGRNLKKELIGVKTVVMGVHIGHTPCLYSVQTLDGAETYALYEDQLESVLQHNSESDASTPNEVEDARKNDTVGIHYELPDGRIVRTFGFNGIEKTIKYYFDDGEGGRTATDVEFQTWKPREDLRDFPNAKNPRLPYEFDLLWDIKYMSDLHRELVGHQFEADIRDCMERHEVVL